MNVKHSLIITLILVGLIGLNVYQWQNPKVVEVPSGIEQIDSTAWVQRSAYTTRLAIIDSLEGQNKELSRKVNALGDVVYSYANITGRLRLQKDSLENELTEWQEIPEMEMTAGRPELKESSPPDSLTEDERSFLEKAREDYYEMKQLMDSSLITNHEFNVLPDGMIPANEPKRFIKERQFGGGLFVVTGIVEFQGNQFRQHLELEQIRDIRLDVATTVSDDQSRVMFFVTSQDFESLEYQSFTELKPKNKLPWFWIGVATGVAGTALIIN